MSAMKGAKSDSGAKKRKRKKAQDELIKTQEGAICKHLKKEETTSTALTSRLVVEDLEQEHDVLAADNIADKTEEVIQEKGEDQEMIHLENNDVSTVIQNTNQTQIKAVEINETELGDMMDVSQVTVSELEITNADNAVDWNDIGC